MTRAAFETGALEMAKTAMASGNVVDYLFEHQRGMLEKRRTYLTTPEGGFTFDDLYRRTCQVAALLQQQAVGPGDRVMFSVRDGFDFPSLFLGAMKIGAVSVPINTFLKTKDYAYYLKDSGAKVAIVDQTLAQVFWDAAEDAPALEHMYVCGGGYPYLQSLDAALMGMPDDIPTCSRAWDDTAFWLYSSGSTGDPKGVVHTHDHIRAASELFGLAVQKITKDDIILCPPKMFFAFGLGNQVYFPIRTGARVIVDPNPAKPEAVLASLLEHQPTLFVAVPTLYAGIANLMRGLAPETIRTACKRLRFCVSGGEVLPPHLLSAWSELTGTEILDGVGTTEMTHMFIINRAGHVVPGSCGRVVEGFKAQVIDDDGRELPIGEIGNLFVQGPTAAHEYWNKPERTRATMRQGGVVTGDKCYRDADGNFFYVGRNDDMLRVGGIWVSPAEVESALAEHPAVLECAVIGVSDENQLTKPKAYVVLRPQMQGKDGLVEEMEVFLRSKLAHYKCPKWIAFTPELPKTATGKIQRFRLRELEAQIPVALSPDRSSIH